MENNLIVLFDMDGTLFDYEGSLKKELEKIRSPFEKEEKILFSNNPEYLENRRKLITSSESFWEDMPKFQLGWDILEIVETLGFRVHILTQGPRNKPAAWSGKKKCVDKHFGDNFDVTITRDKGLFYGKVLVDDFPGYIEKWLKWRPRGLVIMPVNESNKDFEHPQVIKYNGTNLKDVQDALEKIKQSEDIE